MTTFLKRFEAIAADLNQENSKIVFCFERFTKFIFTGVVSLAFVLLVFFLLPASFS